MFSPLEFLAVDFKVDYGVSCKSVVQEGDANTQSRRITSFALARNVSQLS